VAHPEDQQIPDASGQRGAVLSLAWSSRCLRRSAVGRRSPASRAQDRQELSCPWIVLGRPDPFRHLRDLAGARSHRGYFVQGNLAPWQVAGVNARVEAYPYSTLRMSDLSTIAGAAAGTCPARSPAVSTSPAGS